MTSTPIQKLNPDYYVSTPKLAELDAILLLRKRTFTQDHLTRDEGIIEKAVEQSRAATIYNRDNRIVGFSAWEYGELNLGLGPDPYPIVRYGHSEFTDPDVPRDLKVRQIEYREILSRFSGDANLLNTDMIGGFFAKQSSISLLREASCFTVTSESESFLSNPLVRRAFELMEKAAFNRGIADRSIGLAVSDYNSLIRIANWVSIAHTHLIPLSSGETLMAFDRSQGRSMFLRRCVDTAMRKKHMLSAIGIENSFRKAV